MLPHHRDPDIACLPTIFHKLQQENYHLHNHNQPLSDLLQEPDLHSQCLYADCVFIKQYHAQLLIITLPDRSPSVWLRPKVTLFVYRQSCTELHKKHQKRFIHEVVIFTRLRW